MSSFTKSGPAENASRRIPSRWLCCAKQTILPEKFLDQPVRSRRHLPEYLTEPPKPHDFLAYTRNLPRRHSASRRGRGEPLAYHQTAGMDRRHADQLAGQDSFWSARNRNRNGPDRASGEQPEHRSRCTRWRAAPGGTRSSRCNCILTWRPIMNAVYWIWGTTLAIITFVVVPLALHLLHRTLKAAMSIERYARESLTAGVGTANNTAAIPVLKQTLATAGSLVEATKLLKARADDIGSIAVDLAASR